MSKYNKYFEKIDTGNRFYQWSCKLCGYITVPTIHTTTQIRRHHLKSKHPPEFAQIEPRKPFKKAAAPNERKREIKEFIIENTPLKKAKTEDGKNKDYFEQQKLPELYDKLSTTIKDVTSKLESYSIVIGEWTEEGFSHSLLSITIHFLDNELKLQNYILAVQSINKYKVDEKIPERLEEIFEEFYLEWSKVTHFLQAGNSSGTTDFEDINDWDIEKCLGLGLQQSVEDAMTNMHDLDTVMHKIKKFLRKLRKSKSLHHVFREPQKLEEIQQKYLDENVQIPWNILYSIFLQFQENKIALQVFVVENEMKEGYTLEQNEWEILDEFIESLSGFNQASSLLFRSDSTISTIIPILKVIMLDLETKKKKKSNKVDAQLIDGLLESLKKRFSTSLTNKNNIIATLLDPRFKDKYFPSSMNDCYKEWIINDLIGEFDIIVVPKIEVNDDSYENGKSDDLFALFEKTNESKRPIPNGEGKKQVIEAELIKYLHEPTITRESSPSDYWNINSCRFPYLKQLYCKHATAPATINKDAVDKFLSLTGYEMDKMRKTLNNETLKQMSFLNCNFNLLDLNSFSGMSNGNAHIPHGYQLFGNVTTEYAAASSRPRQYGASSIDITTATAASSMEPPATSKKAEKQFTPDRKKEIRKLISEKKCEIRECKTTLGLYQVFHEKVCIALQCSHCFGLFSINTRTHLKSHIAECAEEKRLLM
uniref:BED-type domain-containing protein n=1 Tax=Panagrolaimus sp. PS1159 TaxID=55785 RepID=A0AC35FT17_9BILA